MGASISTANRTLTEVFSPHRLPKQPVPVRARYSGRVLACRMLQPSSGHAAMFGHKAFDSARGHGDCSADSAGCGEGWSRLLLGQCLARRHPHPDGHSDTVLQGSAFIDLVCVYLVCLPVCFRRAALSRASPLPVHTVFATCARDEPRVEVGPFLLPADFSEEDIAFPLLAQTQERVQQEATVGDCQA